VVVTNVPFLTYFGEPTGCCGSASTLATPTPARTVPQTVGNDHLLSPRCVAGVIGIALRLEGIPAPGVEPEAALVRRATVRPVDSAVALAGLFALTHPHPKIMIRGQWGLRCCNRYCDECQR